MLLAALFLLQSADAPKSLVHALPPYGAVAIAALLALATCRSDSVPGRLCLATTALFFGYVVLRALASPAPYHARADLYCVLASLALYGVLLIAFTNARNRILLLLAIQAVALIHVVISVVQAGLGENYSLLISSLEEVEASERGSGLYVNPDHLAGLLEVVAVFGLSITCWSRLPGWAKVCAGYLTAICYLGLVLTGSRGGYLSVAASVVVFGVLSLIALRSAGRRVLLKFGGTGLLILAAAVVASWLFIQQSPPLKKRVDKLLVDEGRLHLWHAAVEQWRLRPFVGTGSGTYLFYGREFQPPRFLSDPVDVHNDYLHLLAEYGLIGAAGFLLFLAAHLLKGWRTFVEFGPRRLAAGTIPLSDRLALSIGALAAVSAYIVHSAVDFNLHLPANALLLALVFGILANPGLDRASRTKARMLILLPRTATSGIALVLLVQCVRLVPGERYAEEARVALRDEDPASALSLAQTALQHEQENPRIYFYIGRAQLALARNPEQANERDSLIEGAIAAFDKARQLVPLDGNYPLEMAFAYDRLGRFEEAEPLYEVARARDPHSTTLAALYEAHLKAWEKARQQSATQPAPPPTSPPP